MKTLDMFEDWMLSIDEFLRVCKQRAIADKSPAHAKAIAYFERIRKDDRLWK